MNTCRRQFVLAPVALLAADTLMATKESTRVGTQIVVSDKVIRPQVPAAFLSFNLNLLTTQKNFWKESPQGIHEDAVAFLRQFPGAIHRYPGGLISNTLAWEWAVGPLSDRLPQKGEKWAPSAPVQFGPDEYFDYLRKVGGQSWYTLNLVGWSETELVNELPSSTMAESNGRLAARRLAMETRTALPRYYQLGNELDRSVYEWPVDKYLARSRETIKAVKAADPDASIVAFLRDFDWTHRQRQGVSRAADFSEAVLKGLPDVQDVSLQLYYDRPEESGGKVFDIAWRMKLVDRFIAHASALRPGLRVWVTEHAKAKPDKVDRPEWRLASTSGIDGAIASGDMCIWLLQRPAVQATMWHALGGAPWWDLFRSVDGRLVPTPVYLMFDLFRRHSAGQVMQRQIEHSGASAYSGGYDVNAAVLAKGGGSLDRNAWVINRGARPASIRIADRAMAGARVRVELETLAAAGADNGLSSQFDVVQTRHRAANMQADPVGGLTIELPARCVAGLRLTQPLGA